MKRIGILSDTHSHWDERYVKYFADCDEIWHAGDIGDINLLARLNEIGPEVRAVSGNVDHGEVTRICPKMLIFDIENVKVLLTHIGGYPGRYAPGIADIIRQERVKLFVDGHSHILKVMYDNRLDCLHVNPGAAGTQGWQKVRTLIRLEIDGAEIKNLEVIELIGKE